jgi:hypothetical protein
LLALQQELVQLDLELMRQLPLLAASVVWAHGPAVFTSLARLVKSRIDPASKTAKLSDFVSILSSYEMKHNAGSDFEILTRSDDNE